MSVSSFNITTWGMISISIFLPLVLDEYSIFFWLLTQENLSIMEKIDELISCFFDLSRTGLKAYYSISMHFSLWLWFWVRLMVIQWHMNTAYSYNVRGLKIACQTTSSLVDWNTAVWVISFYLLSYINHCTWFIYSLWTLSFGKCSILFYSILIWLK